MPRHRILSSDRSINQLQDKSRSHTSSSCPHAQLLLLLLLLLLPFWTGTVYECVCSVDWVSRGSVELLETFPLTAHTICTLRKSPLLDRMTVAVSTVTHTGHHYSWSPPRHVHTHTNALTPSFSAPQCLQSQLLQSSRLLRRSRSVWGDSSVCWYREVEEAGRGGVLVCVCDTEREIMFEEVSKREGELRLSSAPADFLFYFSIQSKVTSSFETCAAHLKISTARKFPTAGL